MGSEPDDTPLLVDIDWAELLRDISRVDDPQEQVALLLEAHRLAQVEGYVAPEAREGLLRRIEAMGRVARKNANRLAAEQPPAPVAATKQPATPAAVSADPAVAVPTAPAAVVEAPATADSGTDQAATENDGKFTVDPATELADFTTALRKELAARRTGPTTVTDEQAAAALAEWHAALTVEGEPTRFVSWPGWTGMCLAKRLTARYPQITMPTPIPVGSRVWELTRSRDKMSILSWTDQDHPPVLGMVISELDVNAQYLAAARSTLVGDGDPMELDAAAVATWEMRDLVKRPGYLVLAAAPDLTGLPPHARHAFRTAKAGSILSTPLATYLVRDHQVALDVAEAVVWDTRRVIDPRTAKAKTVPAYGKRLDRWAKTLEDGRALLMARGKDQDRDHPALLALLLLKRTYSQFVGATLRSIKHNTGPGGEPTGWLRPDWHDQDVGTAGANMLRSLDKAYAHGWHACGGLKDSVWFLSEPGTTSAPEGMELSTRPGRWKLNRWAVVDQTVVDAFATGRPQHARSSVNDAHEARITLEGAA